MNSLGAYLNATSPMPSRGFSMSIGQEFGRLELTRARFCCGRNAEKNQHKPRHRAAKIRAEIEAGSISRRQRWSIPSPRVESREAIWDSCRAQGVMLDGFSAALFKLKKGELGSR